MGNSTLPLGGGDARRISEIILQPGHSFVAGDVVRADDTTPNKYVLAQANTSENAEAVGIVETAAGDSFELVYQGRIDLSAVVWTDSPFAATSEVWFLSDTTAGELTRTPPSTAGTVIKAMLVVTDDTGGAEEGVLTGYIGVQIGGDNLVDLNDIQPLGTIQPWAAPSSSPIPNGWALCDGQEISRTTFSDLFSLITTTYGVGDGSTTFNVPDLRGRVGVGLDGVSAGVLTSNNNAGDSGGEEDHMLVISELPDHQLTLGLHMMAFTGGVNLTLVPLGAGNQGDVPQGFTPDPGNPPNPVTGVPHNTMQPFLVLNYLIRITSQSKAAILDHDLSGHNDVADVSSPNDCDVLKFNNGQWENHPQFLSVRNRLINGQFDIWQRDVTFPGIPGVIVIPSGLYTSDRWHWGFNADGGTLVLPSSKVDRVSFVAGQTEVPGNPLFFVEWTTDFAGAGGNEFSSFVQRIEEVRTLAGQKATFSFWAKGTTSGDILVSLLQNFGSGGSSTLQSNFTPITLTTSWTRYVVTMDVPSIFGKTFGSGSFLSVRFTNILGSTVAAGLGTVSVNFTGTISISNVQFEIGSLASPFEKKFLGTELELAQRYYQKSYQQGIVPGTGTLASPERRGEQYFHAGPGSGGTNNVRLMTTMRESPSVVLIGPHGVLFEAFDVIGIVTGLTLSAIGENAISVIWGVAPPPHLDGSSYSYHYTADAEL